MMIRAKKMVLTVVAKETEKNVLAFSSHHNNDNKGTISIASMQSENSGREIFTSAVYPFVQNPNAAISLSCVDTSATLGDRLVLSNNDNPSSLPMRDDCSVYCGSTDEQSAAYSDIQPEGECCNQITSTGIAENLDEILTLNSISNSQFTVTEEGEYIVTSENNDDSQILLHHQSDNVYNCMSNLEPTLDLQNLVPVTSDTVNVNGNNPHNNEYIVPLDKENVRDTSNEPDGLPNVLSNEESENGLGKESDEQQRGLGDSGRQKGYIASLLSEENVKRHMKRNINSGRVKNKSRFYSVPRVSALDASRKTKKSKPLYWDTIELTQKYPERIPVSVAKKKDLLHLPRTGVMPTDYAAFIEGIPFKKGIRDLVPYQEGSDGED
ncbi:hypothetical protein PR048_003534 [Dryococelus australis]|uniref:Uncharacterized protein n=1 Tax=Dryococelus australis TaxID=614101 RepID=A0ABQ9INE3_9NEOP|nr:hypothetical protein PR048_003534 [Dryococelus australis]